MAAAFLLAAGFLAAATAAVDAVVSPSALGASVSGAVGVAGVVSEGTEGVVSVGVVVAGVSSSRCLAGLTDGISIDSAVLTATAGATFLLALGVFAALCL